jgi:hypothetical protein
VGVVGVVVVVVVVVGGGVVVWRRIDRVVCGGCVSGWWCSWHLETV